MRAAGRRRAQDSLPATPGGGQWQFTSTLRDSDSSFARSRPSSASARLNPRSSTVSISDKSYQLSAIRTINGYLSSHNLKISLKPPLPSASDIIETLKFILARLGFQGQKMDDDLQLVLKTLNCPFKLNKSALRAPSTPHSWPNLLAAIHWLVQICMYNDHLMNASRERPFFEGNNMFQYALNSYLYFIHGDDESVDALDEEYINNLTSGKEEMGETLKNLEAKVKELQGALEALKTGPSQREVLEKEKHVLEEDVKKIQVRIGQWDGHKVAVEKGLEEKEKELDTKLLETKRVKEGNDELKRKIEEQGINARDAERIRKELMALERDIAEAEVARNGWEEKVWDLDFKIGHKMRELDELIFETNQAIQRLKLGNEYRFQLNPKGSTPAELLGMDNKSRVKHDLATLEERNKKRSLTNLEVLISLQQQSAENVSMIEAKKISLADLNSHVDEVEAQIGLMKKEMREYTSRCATEARQMEEAVLAEERDLEIIEREAAEFLKASKMKLQEVTVVTAKEVELCASELFALIDSVSKYKEYVASKVSGIKHDLWETAGSITDIHKMSLPSQILQDHVKDRNTSNSDTNI